VTRAPFMLARSVLALFLVAVSAVVPAMAAQLTFDLKVERGRVAENMRLIRVKQGDAVTLRWTSDQPLVVHLHGYDIEKRVAPGPTTEMTFTAYATGRFPIHVHMQAAGGRAHEEAPLVNVEVYPR
jgi:plastocyanin